MVKSRIVLSLASCLGTGLTAGVSVDVCDCGGEVCDCRNANFESFPFDIPQSAIIWNFNENNLFEFSTTDLSIDSVKELHLANNKLGYFRDTERKHWSSLEVLDLRNGFYCENCVNCEIAKLQNCKNCKNCKNCEKSQKK